MGKRRVRTGDGDTSKVLRLSEAQCKLIVTTLKRQIDLVKSGETKSVGQFMRLPISHRRGNCPACGVQWAADRRDKVEEGGTEEKGRERQQRQRESVELVRLVSMIRAQMTT